jgi:hypothetical protein
VNSGASLEFTYNGVGITAQGTITVNGSNSTAGPGNLIIDRPTGLYVVGATGPSGAALTINGTMIMNAGGNGACPTPTSGNPTSIAVVQHGSLSVGAGSTSLFRLCQTAVILADGYSAAGGPPNAWPTAPGAVPYSNSFNGTVSISGQGSIDWTAPNAVPNGPASQADWTNHLEDLTLWTETGTNSGSDSSIAGNGSAHLAGVFALPNANPFSLGGLASQTISADAQFWTRKLRLAGNATVEMAPNPNDSIPFIDFVLVR